MDNLEHALNAMGLATKSSNLELDEKEQLVRISQGYALIDIAVSLRTLASRE